MLTLVNNISPLTLFFVLIISLSLPISFDNPIYLIFLWETIMQKTRPSGVGRVTPAAAFSSTPYPLSPTKSLLSVLPPIGPHPRENKRTSLISLSPLTSILSRVLRPQSTTSLRIIARYYYFLTPNLFQSHRNLPLFQVR
jgi:hypothetical protein